MLTAVRERQANWRVGRWRGQVLPAIDALEEELSGLSDAELRRRSMSLRYRAKSGEPLKDLLVEVYALVREASVRTTGMRHFDVQMLGGIALFHGAVAEMETGEGKTLTATLPLVLYGLVGKGAHLATVNDYLARRDAEITGPIYQALGLSVGVIQTEQSQDERRRAYACDITYGTAKEFGFDFLRDRLLLRESGALSGNPARLLLNPLRQGQDEQPVQRGSYFALVDEADSLLIDEARTPLIISSLPGDAEKIAEACYTWAAAHWQEFSEGEHYEYEHQKKEVYLTSRGRLLARRLPTPELMDSVGYLDVYEYLERAIKVEREFRRDHHYIVRDGEVVIVDESTGRLAEGRKWRAGIHQAIEAREGVEVTVDSGQAARVTVQDYFLRYRHLAGMTGTARSAAAELRGIYELQVVRVPTNLPVQRKRLPSRVFGTSKDKWEAVVREVLEVHATGRPVLIGTRSIHRSEAFSFLLEQEGIEHQVLNAHHIEAEAEIIARAGERGKVTVSTNMAGRGTDIKLGSGVAELGGLHVICTELHDSARIDRQLMGRCGRQGDPGTVRQYLSLDDELFLTAYGPKKAAEIARIGSGAGDRLDGFQRRFVLAQNRIERRNYRDRKALMQFEKQQKKLQAEMGQDRYLDTPD